jgi:hypothetical protein
MATIEMVCLANSFKPGGRCIAGVCQTSDGWHWVRPVSRRPSGSLNTSERSFENGTEPVLLDVIAIPLAESCPSFVQPENSFLGEGQWRLVEHIQGASAVNLLQRITSSSTLLFGGAEHFAEADELRLRPAGASLALVRPESVDWYDTTKVSGGAQTRARFHLGENAYDLPMTDPEFQPTSGSTSESPYLTVSLGDVYERTDRCYKIVAGVITRW